MDHHRPILVLLILTSPSRAERHEKVDCTLNTHKHATPTSSAMANNVAEVFTFPTDISEFDSDERISFSRLDNKYIAVQDDGTEFEFDQGLKRWIPLADDDVPGVDDQGPDAGDYGRQPPQQGQDSTDARLGPGRKRKPDHAYYNSEVSCAHYCRCRHSRPQTEYPRPLPWRALVSPS